MARSMATGTNSAWPLAVGVALGDLIWPLAAIGGVGILAQFHSAIMPVLAFIAVMIFIIMGVMLIWKANKTPEHLGRLTRSGFVAGFMAGFLVIISNPKAILFYIGVLPGFFDLTIITIVDALLISLISASIPFSGNLVMAVIMSKSRHWLATPTRIRRLNQLSGTLLIIVGIFIFISQV